VLAGEVSAGRRDAAAIGVTSAYPLDSGAEAAQALRTLAARLAAQWHR
jgi:hypothetical protein